MCFSIVTINLHDITALLIKRYMKVLHNSRSAYAKKISEIYVRYRFIQSLQERFKSRLSHCMQLVMN